MCIHGLNSLSRMHILVVSSRGREKKYSGPLWFLVRVRVFLDSSGSKILKREFVFYLGIGLQVWWVRDDINLVFWFSFFLEHPCCFLVFVLF